MSTKGVVACVVYAGGRRLREVALEDTSETLGQPGHFVWIGLVEPDADVLGVVQHEFSLHELAVEDAQRAHQRPKLERYGNGLFVVLHTIQVDEASEELRVGETHVFVGPQYVVSVRHGPSTPYTQVRARVEASPHLLAKGPGFVLYALMDFIVDQYFPAVEFFERRLDGIEEQIFREGMRRDTTERIYDLKRSLLQLKRAISPLLDVTNRLARADFELIPEDTHPYFRDVYDHVVRINEMVDILRELLTSALEANLSLISVGQNEAMKRLAGWAAIIAVPTMVAGVYGMNFKFMPELDWLWGYPVALAVMGGVSGYLYLRFKRSGWL
jgi:magnesium transporter